MGNLHEALPHMHTTHARQIVEYFGADERLHDDTMRRDYLAHLNASDFVDLLQRTAGLIRHGHPDATAFDGDGVTLYSHEVPDQRDKEQLIRETWDVAQQFLTNNALNNRDALDLAALTVAGGVLYAHPYMDGNGRTTRALTYIMAHGPTDTQQLDTILASHNGGGNWQVTPLGIVSPPANNFGGNQPDNIHWDDDEFIGAGSDPLDGQLANSFHKETVMRLFIENHSDDLAQQIKHSTIRRLNGDIDMDANKLLDYTHADPNQALLYTRELLEYRRTAQADYVRRFLRAMQSKRPIKLAGAMPAINLDVPEGENARRNLPLHRLRTQLSRYAMGGLVTPAAQALAFHRAYSAVNHRDQPH